MAACRSTTEWNTPCLSLRRVSLAKKPSTALSQVDDVGVKWKVQRGRAVERRGSVDRRSCCARRDGRAHRAAAHLAALFQARTLRMGPATGHVCRSQDLTPGVGPAKPSKSQKKCLHIRCLRWRTFAPSPVRSATCPRESVLQIRLRPDFSVGFEGYAGGTEHWPRLLDARKRSLRASILRTSRLRGFGVEPASC